jgi:hypothetical protein
LGGVDILKKLILILMIAISNMTFASLQDVNDYDVGEAPEVLIPQAIAGGLVLTGGAVAIGGIGIATMMVVPEFWMPAVIATIAVGATAAIAGVALGGVDGIPRIFD